MPADEKEKSTCYSFLALQAIEALRFLLKFFFCFWCSFRTARNKLERAFDTFYTKYTAQHQLQPENLKSVLKVSMTLSLSITIKINKLAF